MRRRLILYLAATAESIEHSSSRRDSAELGVRPCVRFHLVRWASRWGKLPVGFRRETVGEIGGARDV